jgi:hypothetical protein
MWQAVLRHSPLKSIKFDRLQPPFFIRLADYKD